MVGFFNKDDEGGNYGTAEKEGDTSAGNTRTDEQTSKSNQTQERQTADSIVGIDGLMDKRVKLEESINYVGHMIKTLKDKRARLLVSPCITCTRIAFFLGCSVIAPLVIFVKEPNHRIKDVE